MVILKEFEKQYHPDRADVLQEVLSLYIWINITPALAGYYYLIFVTCFKKWFLLQIVLALWNEIFGIVLFKNICNYFWLICFKIIIIMKEFVYYTIFELFF